MVIKTELTVNGYKTTISPKLQLFKGDSIGRFDKKDIGIKAYLEEEVWNIRVEDEFLEIALKY